MLPMFFSGGIWWIVTSGGAVKPTAPRWLREGPRSIQNCMSFGATPNSCSSTPRVQSAAVCWYSGTPTRRPFRSAGRSMPESLLTRISAWKNFLVVKTGRPTQRSSPFDRAIISEENDISETSKSAKRSCRQKSSDGCTRLGTMVLLPADVPEDAFTAGILGTERIGNGVVIRDDGLVLTIGYLITEATTIWLNTNKGTAVPGHPLAYDQPTGFGLVQPLGRLGAPALARGTAAASRVGDDGGLAGHGGGKHALQGQRTPKRALARHW